MAYTVTQAIVRAFNMSKIVSREFETVDSPQLATGLLNFNRQLGKTSIDIGMIPYETTGTFTAVAGQEEYYIPNLLSVDTLTFMKDSLRYACLEPGRDLYQGSPRVDNINSLPYSYHAERTLNGTNIFLYFWPDEAYVFTYWGSTVQTKVDYNDDLELIMEDWYSEYLTLATARALCLEYAYRVPAHLHEEYMNYVALIKKQSKKMDLHLNKVSTLHKSPPSLNYALINIGPWFPTTF